MLTVKQKRVIAVKTVVKLVYTVYSMENIYEFLVSGIFPPNVDVPANMVTVVDKLTNTIPGCNNMIRWARMYLGNARLDPSLFNRDADVLFTNLYGVSVTVDDTLSYLCEVIYKYKVYGNPSYSRTAPTVEDKNDGVNFIPATPLDANERPMESEEEEEDLPYEQKARSKWTKKHDGQSDKAKRKQDGQSDKAKRKQDGQSDKAKRKRDGQSDKAKRKQDGQSDKAKRKRVKMKKKTRLNEGGDQTKHKTRDDGPLTSAQLPEYQSSSDRVQSVHEVQPDQSTQPTQLVHEVQHERSTQPTQLVYEVQPVRSRASTAETVDDSIMTHQVVDLLESSEEEGVDEGVITPIAPENLQPVRSRASTAETVDDSIMTHQVVDLLESSEEEGVDEGVITPENISTHVRLRKNGAALGIIEWLDVVNDDDPRLYNTILHLLRLEGDFTGSRVGSFDERQTNSIVKAVRVIKGKYNDVCKNGSMLPFLGNVNITQMPFIEPQVTAESTCSEWEAPDAEYGDESSSSEEETRKRPTRRSAVPRSIEPSLPHSLSIQNIPSLNSDTRRTFEKEMDSGESDTDSLDGIARTFSQRNSLDDIFHSSPVTRLEDLFPSSPVTRLEDLFPSSPVTRLEDLPPSQLNPSQLNILEDLPPSQLNILEDLPPSQLNILANAISQTNNSSEDPNHYPHHSQFFGDVDLSDFGIHDIPLTRNNTPSSTTTPLTTSTVAQSKYIPTVRPVVKTLVDIAVDNLENERGIKLVFGRRDNIVDAIMSHRGVAVSGYDDRSRIIPVDSEDEGVGYMEYMNTEIIDTIAEEVSNGIVQTYTNEIMMRDVLSKPITIGWDTNLKNYMRNNYMYKYLKLFETKMLGEAMEKAEVGARGATSTNTAENNMLNDREMKRILDMINISDKGSIILKVTKAYRDVMLADFSRREAERLALAEETSDPGGETEEEMLMEEEVEERNERFESDTTANETSISSPSSGSDSGSDTLSDL